jgi:pilus assembly protein CpaF
MAQQMTNGWSIITPFLRPIEDLLFDPSVSEIMRNGDGSVFVERGGRITHMPDIVLDEEELGVAVENIARVLGTDINDQMPMLDGRLSDGSRVAAVLPPIAQGGVVLNIRKFDSRRFSIDELVRIGTVTEQALEIIAVHLADEQNVLISGGTSTGKTTMLNALSPYLGDVRIVLIEDTAELQLHQANVVRMVARREPPAVTIRDLVRMAMRQRPDRIIVGEVRGLEAFELLSALNSGHGGSMATIHAESARQAVSKLATYVLQAGEIPLPAIDRRIADAIRLVVQLRRDRATGRRYVSEIVRLEDYDQRTGQHVFCDLWRASGQADGSAVRAAQLPAG